MPHSAPNPNSTRNQEKPLLHQASIQQALLHQALAHSATPTRSTPQKSLFAITHAAKLVSLQSQVAHLSRKVHALHSRNSTLGAEVVGMESMLGLSTKRVEALQERVRALDLGVKRASGAESRDGAEVGGGGCGFADVLGS